ncbi:hypothetical protein IKL64_01995 [bacterium]|nr:hypothetical protein [bacterium]
MLNRFFILIIVLFVGGNLLEVEAKSKDIRSRELKHQYEVLKDDAKKEMEGKIYNMTPSGYMTVDEYEALSEYKDKSNLQIDIPKFQTPSDFKYVPKPLYRVVKYNDPPGSAEISLGKRLYKTRQVNAQGIVSPDFSMMVYPAVYYYTNSASVACDLFIIPLEDGDTNLNKILRANTAKKLPDPIMSTDKTIDNYAAFRTLTPVDFTPDGSKLLVKQKIGSREDGIWETSIYVYDFKNKVDYDLFEIRDAVVYFWEEYMGMNLDEKRWDIYPIGFDKKDPNKIFVQAFAFTGEKPVFLGTWSVDWQGNQSRLISFDKNFMPEVSVNGFKLIQDGIESYDAVEKEKELQVKKSEEMKKEYKKRVKQTKKMFKQEYEYTVKGLKQDYKDEYRDYKKLRSLSGNVESSELQSAYKQYLIDQARKDIDKTQKQIDKKQKEIDKIDSKIDKLYDATGDSSKFTPSEQENSSNESVES